MAERPPPRRRHRHPRNTPRRRRRRSPTVDPVVVNTRDEVADVADALNTVQDTALDLAVEQAVLRRNIADTFVNLGRRNQNLLGRQLDFITELETNETDPDTLANLFRLDHLATRMRRNAESLLVLAGIEPPRKWAAPVRLTDVIRAALGEVEDYQRVTVRGVEPATILGSAAADLAHLLAELIENALVFSPPDQTVDIRGRTNPRRLHPRHHRLRPRHAPQRHHRRQPPPRRRRKLHHRPLQIPRPLRRRKPRRPPQHPRHTSTTPPATASPPPSTSPPPSSPPTRPRRPGHAPARAPGTCCPARGPAARPRGAGGRRRPPTAARGSVVARPAGPPPRPRPPACRRPHAERAGQAGRPRRQAARRSGPSSRPATCSTR